MDEHLNRPKSNNPSHSQPSESNDFVTGKKANPKDSNGLKETFLQQLTGSAKRGAAKPLRSSGPKASTSASGPVPAGDVKTQTPMPLGQPDSPHPSLSSFSMSGLSAATEHRSPFSESHAAEATQLGEPSEAIESQEVMSQYRRVVYPPTSHTTQELEVPSIARTASYPSLPSLSALGASDAQLIGKSAFDSITQSDIDRSSTSMDPIAPYIKQAHYRTTSSGSLPASQGTAKPHELDVADTERFRTARSIHFESTGTESTASRAPQYNSRSLRSALDFATSSSMPMATSGAYRASPSTHFMYRPRIPSLRYVRVEDPAYYKMLAFTEHLEALAPWLVGAIFTMAGILALVIILSL
ncbi:MAG: hypothetical protein EP343_28390 [Deltaproteobacteria bacterium]|nr:MAG: hypothetical protein EP343_28390 [Deltaproteobacteria bacterium]